MAGLTVAGLSVALLCTWRAGRLFERRKAFRTYKNARDAVEEARIIRRMVAADRLNAQRWLKEQLDGPPHQE